MSSPSVLASAKYFLTFLIVSMWLFFTLITVSISDPYATLTGKVILPHGSRSVKFETLLEMSSEFGTITSARSNVSIWVERILILRT